MVIHKNIIKIILLESFIGFSSQENQNKKHRLFATNNHAHQGLQV